MNKVYKLKFSKAKKQLQVVSELATNADTGSNAVNSTTSTIDLEFNPLVQNTVLAGLTATLAVATTGMAQADVARTGMDVVSGTVTAITNGAVTEITNSANAIINWQKFNINENEIVKFIQQSSSSAVLNRVLGGEISQILGTLQSNGQVFIVNPAGIVFGKNSTVDVSSLVASTLDITNEDFLNGNYVFNQDKDKAIAQVLSQGMIKVNDDGTLALVGGQVVNTGVLEARNGSVYLLAGQSITIQDLDNPLISYKVTAENKAVNLGEIVSKRATLLGNKVANGYTSSSEFADVMSGYATSATNATINADGEIVLFGASVADEVQTTAQTNVEVKGERNSVVSNTGTLNASNPKGKAGKVKVLGDKVEIGSTSVITATGEQGGEILIGGDNLGTGNVKLSQETTVEAGAKVDASAKGQAGTVVLWGDQAKVDGTFLATSETSYGGLVETSGKGVDLADGFEVNTSSLLGGDYFGKWLLDPVYVVIASTTSEAQNILRSKGWKADGVLDPRTGRYISNVTILDQKELNNKLKNNNIDLVGEKGVVIRNVTASSSTVGRFYVFSNEGTAEVNNFTANLPNANLKIYGKFGMTLNNSYIDVKTFELGTGDGKLRDEIKNTADLLKVKFDVANTVIKGSATGNQTIRAQGWGGFNMDNVTIETTTPGSLLDIQSNADNRWNKLKLKAYEVALWEPQTNKEQVSVNIIGSDLNVTTRFFIENQKADFVIKDTNVRGGDFTFIHKSVLAENVTADTRIIGFTALEDNLDIRNSNVVTQTSTSLVSKKQDVIYTNTDFAVGSGSLTMSAGNNVTVSDESFAKVNFNEDASINIHGGNTATIDRLEIKAANINVSGGTVDVQGSTLEAEKNLRFDATNELKVEDNELLSGKETVAFTSQNSDVIIKDNTITTQGDLVVESTKNVELYGDRATYNLAPTANVKVKAGKKATVGNFDNELNSITAEGKDVEFKDNKFKLNEGFNTNLEGNLALDNTTVLTEGDVNVAAAKGVTLTNKTSLTGSQVTVASEADVTVNDSTLAATGTTVDVKGATVSLDRARLSGVDAVNLTATVGSVTAESTVKTNASNLNIHGNQVVLTNSSFTGNDTGYATITSDVADGVEVVNTTIRRYLCSTVPESVEYEKYLGPGLYNFGPAGEAAERSEEKTGEKDRDTVGDTTNSNIADKSTYTTGDSLVQHEGKAVGDGLYYWNSGAETENPNVAYKEGYTSGDSLVQQEGKVVGDGLTREIVFTTDNVEKGNTPNDKIGDLDTSK
ncbi:hypothetical protein CJP74_05560, partial [Psittacicella melopsittaci]